MEDDVWGGVKMTVGCDYTDCSYNKDGQCDRAYINIELELTGSGFLPICQNAEYGKEEE